MTHEIHGRPDLRAMREAARISICANARGDSLPTRITGTPIDWNQNGRIDTGTVDLWGSNSAGNWFINLNDSGRAWFGWNEYTHRDVSDWKTVMLEREPFIGVGGYHFDPFIISEPDSRRDLKWVTQW
jgi:hypothetical protein